MYAGVHMSFQGGTEFMKRNIVPVRKFIEEGVEVAGV